MNEQWISVKDRLPKGEPIWVCASGSRHDARFWALDSYAPKNFSIGGITHWMPATLPDPPKSEAERAFFKLAATSEDHWIHKNSFLAGWQAHEKRGEG